MIVVMLRDATSNRLRLLRHGLALEYATLGWNVVGASVLLATAVDAGSVALAGFGVDSLIEIRVERSRVAAQRRARLASRAPHPASHRDRIPGNNSRTWSYRPRRASH